MLSGTVHDIPIVFAIFIMNTIFADNKIIEQSCTVQQASLRNIPLAPQLPLRMSCSPVKAPNAKKFFFPARNLTSKPTDNQTKLQLDTLAKRQKLMMLAQKSQFNEMILTPNVILRENQVVSFPSLEIKNINPIENKSPVRRPRDKETPFEFKFNDFKKEYCSNILGNFSAPQSDHNQIKWASQRKIDSPSITSKGKRLNISIMKTSVVESQTKQTRQISIKERRPYPESTSPAPNIISRMKSQLLMEPNIESPTKKYKKGYLYYQLGGSERWQKITVALQKPAKIDVASRIVTAKIFYVVDTYTFEPVATQQHQEEIQIASLSKIMTCYLTILISKKYEFDLKQIAYRVPDWVPETPGTSAQLQAGDVLSAYDLLYGLMLPSGNDAALCLADVMGKCIQRYRKKEQKKNYVDTFLAHMNMFSKELKLPQEWRNPHGLAANPNYSTAQAITALTLLALQDNIFTQVISTRQYEVTIKNDRYGLSRKAVWRNTNKLLEKEGWSGVKTGTTDTAGHCLMALRSPLLIGVFDCQTLSKRFTDTVRLCDYITSHKAYR